MAIEFFNVSKSFPGVFGSVIDEIDFSLGKGDFCTLIGANGSGKSTFLKLMSGEYEPSSGRIHREGQIAQVVQDVNQGTLAEMTLLENLAFAYTRLKKPQFAFYKRYRDTIIDLLKGLDLGLEAFIDRPLKYLSGGQRQVIALLMAVNSGADILLLDEHTSALDPKMQIFLMQYTAQLIGEKQLTAVMITHKMDDALLYGNRLMMLNQGKMVLDLGMEAKKQLSLKDLLGLFHRYEDENLVSDSLL
jgi:putative ABC transport system ATP-binding protein